MPHCPTSSGPHELRIALEGPGALANQKSESKLTKYRDLSDRYEVRPFAVETFGAMSKTARELTDTLAGMADSLDRVSHCNNARSLFYGRIAIAMQAGNARAIVEAHCRASNLSDSLKNSFNKIRS